MDEHHDLTLKKMFSIRKSLEVGTDVLGMKTTAVREGDECPTEDDCGLIYIISYEPLSKLLVSP